MIPALATILCFHLAGELISRALALPVPGPVVGLLLLVGAGICRPRLIDFLRPAATALLGNLSLFFVPAGVGVIAHLGQFRDNAAGLGLAVLVSTVLAIAVAALTFAWVARLMGDAEGGRDG
ncbi:CidA/LrgA family protein [uncultured Paracoccus sp.]|uniref:CidA/LrgA family protein n=1 Tax=uncultured Paracoccus sp. TaxID=189685 RepID=UPI0025F6B3ED|nr:CidA/LrgA family protein [uncultured Paracoccus sp.]